MAYKSGRCWCCEEQRPVDSHHLRPLEYGGDKNGEQVYLCKGCHSLAHYEAEYYYSTGKYMEIDATVPKETPMGRRLRQLISVIVSTKLEFEDSGSPQNDQRRNTQISWDTMEELAMAHDVKRALKIRSLQRAIKLCVFEMHSALRKKGKL